MFPATLQSKSSDDLIVEENADGCREDYEG